MPAPVDTYDVLRRRYAADVEALAPEMIERLGWSAKRLAAHRTAALRRLVGQARDASLWHRRRLDSVDLDRLDEGDLPVMTKADLMAHFDEVVTDPRLRLDVVEAHLAGLSGDAYLFDRYHAIASGGSSGQRGVFVYDWEAWARRWLGYLRFELRDWRLDPELRRPSPDPSPASRSKASPGRLGFGARA